MDSGLLAEFIIGPAEGRTRWFGPGMTKPRVSGVFHSAGTGTLLLPQAAELLLEAREAPAAIHQVLLAAGPGRMRLRVDVEAQRVARLAPGGAGGEFGAVGHDDLDGVIVGV